MARDERYRQRARTAQQRRETGQRAEFRNLAAAERGPLNVEGVDDFSAMLVALGDAAFGKSLRGATDFAMTVVRAEARKNAKNFRGQADDDQDTHFLFNGEEVAAGFTASQVLKKTGLSKDKNAAWSIVGPSAKAYYATAFVERGYVRTNGKSIPAQPWLVPAFETSRRKIVERWGLKMSKSIEKEIKSRNTRAGG
jgi:hypothetical protein